MSKDLPDHAAVVVIGGGVIGASIAFHLAEAGVSDVVLLERDELAAGSTCKAAGGVRASFSNAANIAIGLRGLEAYAQFARDFEQEIDFRRDGYLYLLSDQQNLDVFTESVALQNAHGVPSVIVSPEEAQRISPLIDTDGLLGAAWSPHDGKATPESVVMGYAAAARRKGARIIRHCEVTGIDSDGGTITGVVTEHGRIATSTVVVAAGAWSRAIGAMVGVDIPVSPVRRQIAFTEPLRELPATSPSLTIDFPSNFYFHPEGKGLLLGWSDPDEPEGFNLKFELDDWLLGLGEIAGTRAPAILDYGIATGWAGLYEVTPDRNQIIDRCKAVEGLLVATGYSGHGFLMGPATGEIVRDLYLGKEPSYDIRSFALDRFSAADIERGETNIV
ncbi:FAD-binding oxidoreductase [Rhodococcus sp. 1R11]|uniref:NAD(P)/FAD-dependent oxidoreductase n=1 Tax=Rhodococcus sp. 1R11 TaxID=2559614 RepID=UPI0010724672|nr:FAD-binding oxidoreductase [Rhodococcus sp. 1R11]TFI42517.1 FAD-binding oxidoreductase [Rhodococcus sp. 1R11]